MVLAGTINKQIVAAINAAGGCAIGLCGKDGELLRARKAQRSRIEDGAGSRSISALSASRSGSMPRAGDAFATSGIIPVIAPIGVGADGETYNINADTVAGAIAGAVKARAVSAADRRRRACSTPTGELIPELTAAEARRLIADGTISGGMIPKIETCLEAVEGGVEAAVILDGRVPHAMLLELFTEGAGTLIRGG